MTEPGHDETPTCRDCGAVPLFNDHPSRLAAGWVMTYADGVRYYLCADCWVRGIEDTRRRGAQG